LSGPQRRGKHEWGIVLFGSRPHTRDNIEKPNWLSRRFSGEAWIKASLEKASMVFKEEKNRW